MLVLYWALNITQECNKRHGCPWCSSNSHSSGTSISCRSFWFRFHWYAWRSSFFCFQEIGIPCIQVSKVQLFFCLYVYNKFGLSVHVIILTSMYICSHAYVTLFIIFFCISRPTAVNLSDAATKLQTLVSKAAETAKDSKAIFQVLTLTQKKMHPSAFNWKQKDTESLWINYVCVNLPYLMCPATLIFCIWN